MKKLHLLTLLAGIGLASSAGAATFSDTYIGYRQGSEFNEPFNNQNIGKSILNFSNVSGYKYGTNFFNADLLMSDSKDPGQTNGTAGAQEAYIVYRHTLSLGAVTGMPMKYGYIKDVGLQAGFDWNTKNDPGYGSKKRMWVVGPTVNLDVPGFAEIGVLELFESNAPTFITNRYYYQPHPALSLAWGLPIGDLPLSFEGYGLWIASKGKLEGSFAAPSVAETHFDFQVMLDAGKVLGGPARTFKVGLEYEYWQNKFGNDANNVPGAFAHTPMIRAEYHF